MRELTILNEGNRKVKAFVIPAVNFIESYEALNFYSGSDITVYRNGYESSDIFVADNRTTHEVVSMSRLKFTEYLESLAKAIKEEE